MEFPVKPMLAERRDAPANDRFLHPFGAKGWVFEPKLDGHRIIARVDDTAHVTLYSRPGNDVTRQYADIAAGMEAMPPGVYDGEVCWMVDGLQTNRQKLANLLSASKADRAAHLRLVVFDTLSIFNTDTRSMPLSDRRRLLEGAFEIGRTINADMPINLIGQTSDGISLWMVVERFRLEGLIAKPLNSLYLAGERGTWKKIKRVVQDTFTVVGWTPGEGARDGLIGALVLAEQQDDGSFRYVGKVGTGWTTDDLRKLAEAFAPFVADKSPFAGVQALRARQHIGSRTVTWLRPALRGTIEFSDTSDDGTPIFPSWKGLVW